MNRDQVSRNELLLVQDAIQDKLNKRTKLREEKVGQDHMQHINNFPESYN